MFVGQTKLEVCVLAILMAANVSAFGQSSDLEIILSEFEMSFIGEGQGEAEGSTIGDSVSALAGGNLDIQESDWLRNSEYTSSGGDGELITNASLGLWGDLRIDNVGGSIPIGVLYDLTAAFESTAAPFGFDLFTDDLAIVGDVGLALLRLEFIAGEILLQDASVKLTARARVMQENLPMSLTFGGPGSDVLFEYTALRPGFTGQSSANSFTSPRGEIRLTAIPEPATLTLLVACVAVGLLMPARHAIDCGAIHCGMGRKESNGNCNTKLSA